MAIAGRTVGQTLVETLVNGALDSKMRFRRTFESSPIVGDQLLSNDQTNRSPLGAFSNSQDRPSEFGSNEQKNSGIAKARKLLKWAVWRPVGRSCDASVRLGRVRNSDGQLLMCAADDEIKEEENKLQVHDDIWRIEMAC